jgi:microcystin-dependent protein
MNMAAPVLAPAPPPLASPVTHDVTIVTTRKLAHMSGQMIAFTPHTTNGATVTLNVDSLGAQPLRSAPGVELLTGTIIQGTPYVAVYNNSDAAFYLQGFFGNPYNIPLGAGMDYWLPTAPNSSFVFPIGQAISRTTYSALFAAMGTTYGTGDGSTTFNLPDKTGRVSAMQEASATRLTSSYFGGNSTTLGATGGAESQTLTLAQLPAGITSSNASQAISVASTVSDIIQGGLSLNNGSFTTEFTVVNATSGSVTSTGNNSIGVTSNNTSGNAHRTVQPTIVCNYILRII